MVWIPDWELPVERQVFAVDDVAAGAAARIFAHEFTGGGLLVALVTIEEDEDGGLWCWLEETFDINKSESSTEDEGSDVVLCDCAHAIWVAGDVEEAQLRASASQKEEDERDGVAITFSK